MMTLQKSMIVAKSDLKMALKVGYVKYGLIAIGALGPAMMILTIGSIIIFDPLSASFVIPLMDALMSPMLGMIAVIPAALISANALVGEREQNTLEPLLCTPLTDKELLLGKVLSSFLPSIVLLLGGIFVTEIATAAIFLTMGLPIIPVPGPAGLFLLLTAGPIMLIAIVSIMILISGKVKRVYEAYQTSGAVVMIFILPMMLPMISMDASGMINMDLVWLSNIITLFIAIILAAVTWALALGRFNRDTMISM
ncbi:hypothetical protein EU527_19535 [Candidatus Thorarchaeota archaeon]|nr:MAG: hypothetical protein EU527_19535 [Candidatus Thorarchaeota archaeon]